jgi:Cu/Ag efflux pump CusA
MFSSFGGLSKEYHLDLDPAKLNYYAIPPSQVIAAIQNPNTNAGGNIPNVGEQVFDVRGLGLIQSLDDMRNVVLATNKSTPIKNIEDNMDEALSGDKAGSNVVKVFGRDLQADVATANKIADVLNQVRGVTDVLVLRSLGQPNIVVHPDGEAAARYGLNSGDAVAIVEAPIGGQTVTQVPEADRSVQYRRNQLRSFNFDVGDCFPATGFGTLKNSTGKVTLSIDVSGLACPTTDAVSQNCLTEPTT